MTDREKAIISAYTGIAMLTGDKFSIFHKYVEDILGRSVWTHELADRAIWEEIREKSTNDFLALCKESKPEYIIKTKDKSDEDMWQLAQAWKSNKDGILFANDDFEIIRIKTSAEWNPATTKPIYTGLYLISIDDLVTVRNFDGSVFRRHDGTVIDVDAWMPLPEPYKKPEQLGGEE